MRIFLTGATGFIGSAIIPELTKAGHQVLGLTRSDAGAKSLIAAGALVHRGDLEDLESLSRGAAASDAVIHCAFDHNFANFMANCEKDKRAIEALGTALLGSDRPLVITSGTGMGNTIPGQPASEDAFNPAHPNPRTISEITGASMLDRGVNVSVVRLPQVHDPVKQGLITYAVQVAREKGISAYLGDGLNRWPAAHVSDVARLYKLVVEKAKPGSRYNAVAEEGVQVKAIAEALARGLNIPAVSLTPEEAPAHFGWLAGFVGADMPASSALTQQRLDWHPTGPTLLADLARMQYA
jgi:nucleoside-diphosphate-sugar epimerase